MPAREGSYAEEGYWVVAQQMNVEGFPAWLLYARPLSDIDHTLARVRVILLLGVLGGTVLALLGGLATAARAMRPIKQLTEAAREIERTRDPTLRVPLPESEDEVAELAGTVDNMLGALEAARADTHEALERQREFVADASHELRTPLTSLLANLELLAEELGGEQADTAQAALRSARRMRRLVGDLLLLARADARRTQSRGPTDLADVLLEAASELGPMAEDHELSIDAQSAVVPGVKDDLHRLTLNLIENAARHTPPGTHIRASTGIDNGTAVLTVEDDGPGIPPELEPRVFDRFVRGPRTGNRGSGLGLAIVRAVAESHGGTVTLEHTESGTGARFVITIPRAPSPATEQQPPRTPARAARSS
jgi:signal transduction histidine kinase